LVVGSGGFVGPVLPPSAPLAVNPLVPAGVAVGALGCDCAASYLTPPMCLCGILSGPIRLLPPPLLPMLLLLVAPKMELLTSMVFFSPASAVQGAAITNASAIARIGSRMVVS